MLKKYIKKQMDNTLENINIHLKPLEKCIGGLKKPCTKYTISDDHLCCRHSK